MTAKKLLLPAMVLTANLLHSNVAFSKDQFEEASKRAKLAMEVCGNGHEATIEWGKVTACDGKPVAKKSAPETVQEGIPPVSVSKNQFAEAEKRAKLAMEVCGNGHEATIEYGKVTACDGKPVAASQNTKPTNQAPAAQANKKEEKKSSLECVVVDKYLYCNDENFYERVSPVVEVQLKKIAKGVVDRNRSAEKSIDHSTSAGAKPSSGKEK